MDADWGFLTFIVGLLVLALQAWNLYISTTIKLWAEQRFVTKKDFLDTLHLWNRTERTAP